jgi:hypothetical protein
MIQRRKTYQFCGQGVKPISALQRGGQCDAAAATHGQTIALAHLHLHDAGRILIYATSLSDAHSTEDRLGTVHAGQHGRMDSGLDEAARA